jgi:transcriptional regulator with XRE-family HTH domain
MYGYQIAAARAITGWSQMELAERAGCGIVTIKNIERDTTEITSRMQTKLTRTFEVEGIVFTRSGVEKQEVAVRTIEGDSFWLEALEDVYQTMIDRPSEVLLFFSDDRESPEEVKNQWRKIKNLGVSCRQLVKEDNTYLLGPIDEYRYVPKEFFINYVTMVYKNKVCVCAENNTKAVIFRDTQMAHTYRNLFNWCWNHADQPHTSTVPDDERI